MSLEGWASPWCVQQVNVWGTISSLEDKLQSLAWLTYTSQHSPSLPPLNLPPPKSNHRIAFPFLGKSPWPALCTQQFLAVAQRSGGCQEPAAPGTIWKLQQGAAPTRQCQILTSQLCVCSCPQNLCWKRAVSTQAYCSLQNSLVYCSLQMRLINLVLPSTLRSTSSVMVLVFILITLRGIRPWVLLAWATEACTSKCSMWVDLWQLIAGSFAHLLDHHTWFWSCNVPGSYINLMTFSGN